MIGVDAQWPLGPQHPDIFSDRVGSAFLGERDIRGEYFFREVVIKQQIFAVNTFVSQNQIDTENIWTCHHDFRQGFEGVTQMDYVLASLQLRGRSSSHVLSLETVKDNNDHRPVLFELATFLQKKPDKRQ